MISLKTNGLWICTAVLAFLIAAPAFAKPTELFSPDKKIKVVIQTEETLSFSVFCDGREIITSSPISLTIEGLGTLGKEPRLSNVKTRSADEKIFPPIKEKRAVIRDRYNEAALTFKGEYSLISLSEGATASSSGPTMTASPTALSPGSKAG